MKRFCFLIGLFIVTAASSFAEDTYFRGFYHGVNVFIRNPYLGQDSGFCIQEIYLNGDLVAKNPNVSAYEIDMQDIEMDSRIVIRIVHKDQCNPALANPEVIKDDLKFQWLKVYVDENQMIWITSKEAKDGFYIVEKELSNGWMPIDTVKTKGGIFINQHTVALDHVKGDNSYRVQYHDPKLDVQYSESFNFHSDKEEISHAINEDQWIIEFTQEVSYWLYNKDSKIIKRGKGVSCNIRKLPNDRYMIKYDGKEVYFEKD